MVLKKFSIKKYIASNNRHCKFGLSIYYVYDFPNQKSKNTKIRRKYARPIYKKSIPENLLSNKQIQSNEARIEQWLPL